VVTINRIVWQLPLKKLTKSLLFRAIFLYIFTYWQNLPKCGIMAGRFRSRGPVFRFVKCFGKNFLENIFKKCIDFFPEMAYNEYNNKREVT
jgi:hypothetical protein